MNDEKSNPVAVATIVGMVVLPLWYWWPVSFLYYMWLGGWLLCMANVRSPLHGGVITISYFSWLLWPSQWWIFVPILGWSMFAGKVLWKEPLRKYSGKTPIKTLSLRLFVVASIFNWSIYFFLNFFGSSEYPRQVGESFGHYLWNEYCLEMGTGYLVFFGILAFIACGVRIIQEIIWRNDPTWPRWKNSGGSPFFDLCLPWPINPDTAQTRDRTVWGPPASKCPACGGELSLANGFQCGSCGTVWNGKEWVKQISEPPSPVCPKCGYYMLPAGDYYRCCKSGCAVYWDGEKWQQQETTSVGDKSLSGAGLP